MEVSYYVISVNNLRLLGCEKFKLLGKVLEDEMLCSDREERDR